MMGDVLGDGPWDPEACSPVAQQMAEQLPGNCTRAQIDTYFDCLNTACEDTLRTCYGVDYRAGSYAGPCGPLIECAVDCACSDDDCVQACPHEQACGDCFTDNLCGEDCSIPSCAAEDGAGLGCSDLLACCHTLDAVTGPFCLDMHRNALMAQGAADRVCSSHLQILALTSDSPECAVGRRAP